MKRKQIIKIGGIVSGCLILGFSYLTVVRAGAECSDPTNCTAYRDDQDINSASGSLGSGTSESFWNGSGYEGLKISVVTKDGQSIQGNPVTYANNPDNMSKNHFGQNNNKVTGVNTDTIYNDLEVKTPPAGRLPQVVDYSGSASNTRIDQYFRSAGVDGIKQMFRDMGIDPSKTNIQDITFLIEPVVSVKIHGQYLTMTAAEAAQKYPGGACDASGKNCMGNLLNNALQNSLYTSEDHYNGLLQGNGTNASDKIHSLQEILNSGLGSGYIDFAVKCLEWGITQEDLEKIGFPPGTQLPPEAAMCEKDPYSKLPECCAYINNDHPICQKQPPTTTCITTVRPGVCDSSDGVYRDPEDWESCIYNQQAYLEESVGNEWCPVYCREDVITTFPNSPKDVLAGYHFQWAGFYWNGKRDCRTKERLTEWYAAYLEADEAVRKNWNLYQHHLARKNASDVKKVADTVNPHRCCDSDGHCSTCCDGVYCYHTGRVNYTGNDEEGGHWNGVHTEESSKKNYYKGTCGCQSYAEWDWNESYASGVPYQKAYEVRKDLIAKLRDCGKIITSPPEYNLKPWMNLEYVETMQYGKTWNLNMDMDKNVTIETNCGKFESGAPCPVKGHVDYYDCKTNNHDCDSDHIKLNPDLSGAWFTYIRVLTEKDLEFTMPEDTYRNVLKPEDFSQDKTSPNDYIKISEWNFPLPVMKPAGAYPINLYYGKVGHQKGGVAHFDQFIGDSGYDGSGMAQGGGELAYECKYHVKNQIVCDPTVEKCDDDPDNPNHPGGPDNPGNPGDRLRGLNLIYRPIKLSLVGKTITDSQDPTAAFPGIDGNGRYPGDNWYGYVSRFILNNRNVEGEEVYNLEPLYHIVLTPARIKDIRNYNNGRMRDGGYADWDLTCEKGTGRRCFSKFIKEYFNKYGWNGTCYNVSSAQFYSCADKPEQSEEVK